MPQKFKISSKYSITETIHETPRIIVLRGFRLSDQQPVILKHYQSDCPTLVELGRLKREYDCGCQAAGPGVIRYFELEKVQHNFLLISEDFGAKRLRDLIPSEGFSIPDFLSIAIQLSEALTTIHQGNIMHKDIKPENIVMNPATGEVKVIDFGIASPLNLINQKTRQFVHFEGTITHCSPEQTRRMNRIIDYHTDFYSLGVTFYEMLCCRLPFVAADTLELIHCHIAKLPELPEKHNPAIPRVISNIIMKLLAKNGEDRYQSGQGLKWDLQQCRDVLTGEIPVFPLGTHDISGRFKIPEKLYGRDREIGRLHAALKRITRLQEDEKDQKTALLLVTGYEGVGKSTLVYEMRKLITTIQGSFIAGECSPLQHNNPYLVIGKVFGGFCRQILAEPASKLAEWKKKISEAVGQNGQILVELIPELEFVLGKQAPVSQAGLMERQNRFNQVFQSFVGSLCSQDYPLVIFLDNLQWIDSASLALLKIILGMHIPWLLIIGAYRNNEVDDPAGEEEAHPLLLALKEFEKGSLAPETIRLDNLTTSDVGLLIQETLSCQPEYCDPLAELVHKKTFGNPFFVTEFLKILYSEGLLHFEDHLDGGENVPHWVWDAGQIRKKKILNNIENFISLKNKKLDADTRVLMSMAACFGSQFTLANLASLITNDKPSSKKNTPDLSSIRDCLKKLWPAIEQGLLVSLDNHYKLLLDMEESTGDIDCTFEFIHEQGRQFFYNLFNEQERKNTHLRIGRVLWAASEEKGELDECLFAVTNQLNLGSELMPDKVEKINLANLNLQAGQKAMQSNAYTLAGNYYRCSIGLLDENGWQTDYRLMFDLHKNLAEAELQDSHFENTDKLYPLLLQHAQSMLDTLSVYSIQLMQFDIQRKHRKALEVERLSLKMFNIDLPESEEEAQHLFEVELKLMPGYLGNRRISDLINAPLLTDKTQYHLMHLLCSTVVTCFTLAQHMLGAWASVKTINHSLCYGHNDISAYGYANYGVNVAISQFEDYDTAYQFGKMATQLAGRFKNLSISCRTYFTFADNISHWKEPLSVALDNLRKSFRYGIEGGDLAFASYAASRIIQYPIICGRSLVKTMQEAEQIIAVLKRFSPVYPELIKPMGLQPLRNLLGQTDSVATFNDEGFSEQEYLERLKDNMAGKSFFYISKIRSLYWFGLYEEGVRHLEYIERAPLLTGRPNIPEAYFFMSLTLLAVYPNAEVADQERYDEIIARYQNKIKTWADTCPANFLHKYLLVEAERARVAGRVVEAMTFYKQGIASASEYDYINNEALGNELYGKFWLEQNEADYAPIHLIRAYVLYGQWGANAKVRDMEQKYPFLLNASRTVPSMQAPAGLNNADAASMLTNSTILPTDDVLTNSLDLSTILKASQALLQEVQIDNLLHSMMQIIMENTGATAAMLVERCADTLLVQASGNIEQNRFDTQQAQNLEECHDIPVSIIQYVARTQELVLINNPAEEHAFTKDSYLHVNPPKSLLCLPLIHQGKLVAILYLENRIAEEVFTTDRVELLKVLSTQAAISLENARYIESLRKQERLEQEMELARQIQTALLPKEIKTIHPDFEIAALMLPAESVGGDYYDVSIDKLGNLWLGIGDVSGHGVTSGLIMMMTLTIHTAITTNYQTSTSEMVNQINRVLIKNVRGRLNEDYFMTFTALKYQGNGLFQYSGAHLDLIVYRKELNKCELIPTPGAWLNVIPDIEFATETNSFMMDIGDILILYTDGIIEAENHQQEMLEIKRFIEIIQKYINDDPGTMRDNILRDVLTWCDAKNIDDITLLVIKRIRAGV